MNSTHMRYNRVGSKGFRINIPRRFSVQRLRARFFYIFGLLSRWRSSYGRALRLTSRKMRNNSSGRGRGSRRSLMTPKPKEVSLPNSRLMRSNSFYSEAIADCLDFIKRSSLSVDHIQKQPSETPNSAL